MTQIGTVYAQALYSLAAEEGCTEEVLSALSALETSVEQEPEFLRLLSTPNLSKEERCKIIDDSFSGKMPEILLNFLKLLTEKGYARHLGECAKAYQAEYDRCHNILRVEAVTAVPLSGPQADRLTRKAQHPHRQDRPAPQPGGPRLPGRRPAVLRRAASGRHGVPPAGGYYQYAEKHRTLRKKAGTVQYGIKTRRNYENHP